MKKLIIIISVLGAIKTPLKLAEITSANLSTSIANNNSDFNLEETDNCVINSNLEIELCEYRLYPTGLNIDYDKGLMIQSNNFYQINEFSKIYRSEIIVDFVGEEWSFMHYFTTNTDTLKNNRYFFLEFKDLEYYLGFNPYGGYFVTSLGFFAKKGMTLADIYIFTGVNYNSELVNFDKEVETEEEEEETTEEKEESKTKPWYLQFIHFFTGYIPQELYFFWNWFINTPTRFKNWRDRIINDITISFDEFINDIIDSMIDKIPFNLMVIDDD